MRLPRALGQNSPKQTLDMLDAIVTFQDVADLTHSFLSFLSLQRAQAAHEHTDYPTTRQESISFNAMVPVVAQCR